MIVQQKRAVSRPPSRDGGGATVPRDGALAPARDRFKARNWYYYRRLTAFFRFVVPPGQRVLEMGCGTGDLLAAVNPTFGVGLDISHAMLTIARRKYPYLHFVQNDAHCPSLTGPFDYIILSDLIGDLEDVQEAFACLKPLAGPETRLIVTYYNYLWEPVLKLAERLGLKSPQNVQNWLPVDDIESFFALAGFARKAAR